MENGVHGDNGASAQRHVNPEVDLDQESVTIPLQHQELKAVKDQIVNTRHATKTRPVQVKC